MIAIRTTRFHSSRVTLMLGVVQKEPHVTAMANPRRASVAMPDVSRRLLNRMSTREKTLCQNL